MSGTKFDKGKPPMSLLPPFAMRGIAQGFGFGAEKYGKHNWMQGLTYSQLYDALMRHLTAYWMGEEIDRESGLSHLYHAGCCIMMLIEMTHIAPEYDDRPCRLENNELSLRPEELRKHIATKAEIRIEKPDLRGDITAIERRGKAIQTALDSIPGDEPMSTEVVEEVKTGDIEPLVLQATVDIPPWVKERSGCVMKCVRCGDQFVTSDERIQQHYGCQDTASWVRDSRT